MLATILRFGLIAGAILSGFSWISEAIIEPTPENYEFAEVVGYAGILLSMSLIYFAIRSWRDQHAAQTLTFAKALTIGVLTDLVASTLYGLFMIFYFSAIFPEFLPEYLAYYRDKIANSELPAAEIAEQLAALDASASFYLNPYFQALVMFATVFLIGLLISLISAWLLRK